MARAAQPRIPGEKLVRTTQRWPQDLRDDIVRQAEAEKRSVASMTVALLRRGLKRSRGKP